MTIVAIVLVVAVTFASIYRVSQSADRTFRISNLVASADVTFASVSASGMSEYKEANGIKASTDPSAANYIGKLRVSVKYKGQGVGLVRVRIAEEWSMTKTENDTQIRTVLPFKLKVPYTIDTPYDTSSDSGNAKKWYDNRDVDQRFYYATPVHCTNDSTESTISLISSDFAAGSFNTNLLPAGADVHVVVEADVVQVNRYPQYWGITQLPWISPESITEEALS